MTQPPKIWGIELASDAGQLELLVHGVYREIARRPTDLHALRQAMIDMLSFLGSAEERTDSNCREVDSFFCMRDDWKTDWNHLPDEFQRILHDMGGTLHDTVSSPEIARNFESTPELLLARVEELKLDQAG